MTQPNATHPETQEPDPSQTQSQAQSQTELQRLLPWLNQHYPDLSVVLYDIGARHGIHYHYRELLQLPKFKVVGFEPDAAEAERLQTAEGDLKTVYPFALGKAEETRTIYLTRHPGCSSLFQPNQALLAEYPPIGMFELVGSAPITTISLDQFVQTYNPPAPDFVKIDTQGAEYDILQGASTVLNQVVGVFLETHLREMYLGEALFPDLHRLLKDAGFRLISCQNNPHYAGEILEMDVAYVRDGDGLPTPEKLLTAVLFCAVHNNLEFAAHLVRRSQLSPETKAQLCDRLNQPSDPPEWVLDSDGCFNLRPTTTEAPGVAGNRNNVDHHTANVGTIREQWK